MKTRFILIIFTLLFLSKGGFAQESESKITEPIQTFQKSDEQSKIRSSLLILEEEYTTARRQGIPSKEFKPTQDLIVVNDGMVRVQLTAKNDVQNLITSLSRLGITESDVFGRILNAWIPIENISQLYDIDELAFVKPVYSIPPDIGAVTSEGDSALQASGARRTFGVNGNGVLVGVLSDSYNFIGGAPAGVTSGDLPGVGNPNGFTTAVTVVADGGTSDEGRAMIEIVHDLAPGAQIFFNTATAGGQATYATAILNLASVSNCDIIVDDVRYFEEPFYMDGVIAQACNTVFAGGVPYFASAGNYAQSSYEAPYRNSGGLLSAHDFNPGAGIDTLQSITVNAGSRINLTLQWDDPWASLTPNSAATDLDVFLINSGGAVVASSTDGNVGNDPTEFIGYVDPNGAGTFQYRIMITRQAGPSPAVLKWVIRNANGLVINEYPPTTVNAQSTGYGHSNATGANAVGAAFWNNTPAFGQTPPLPEGFTSSGGVQIRYNTNGVAIAPVTRLKPEFTATDGTANTFFGNGNNFFGTSAAAPHAAAVAALMLEANGSLTPTQVRNLLVQSAIDMNTPGFDFTTGAGLIQADIAVQLALEAGCNISDITVQSSPKCTNDQLTYSVTLRVSYSGAPFQAVLVVNGQEFAANGANFQDVTLTGLTSDGNSVNVTAFFKTTPGCTLTKNDLFTAPDLLEATIVVSDFNGYNISCNGGDDGWAKVTGSGGVAPYTYDWSNGQSTQTAVNLVAGNYSVTLTDANGCEITENVVLDEPDPLVASISAVSNYNGYEISCNGGSDGWATVSGSGGVEPYAYDWSNGQTTQTDTNLMAGTYDVTITDANGCEAETEVTLTEPPPLTIEAGDNQTVYYGYPPAECADISWSGEGGGVPPYVITWSDGGSQTHEVCPGEFTTTYTVTITDANDCVETDEVTICVIDVRCGKKLDKVELCHVPPGNPGNEHTICVAISAVETHLAHGDMLAACGTDHSCPPAKTNTYLSFADEHINSIGAYPNPFNQSTRIEFSSSTEGNVTMKLYEVSGKEIAVLFNATVKANELNTVNLDQNLAKPGLNICLIQFADGSTEAFKLIFND